MSRFNMRWFWLGIWEISEFTGIGLGRFAPFVFERMIGVKGVEIMQNKSKDDK